MDKVRLEIVGLTTGQSQKSSYTLILGEEGGQIKLPIVIGAFEAQSIALVMENIKPQRPLTHDLLKNFASEYGIRIIEVYINNLVEGVFYSRLICEADGDIREIDARTSDAVAMALRFDCPIYTNRQILDNAGIILEEEMEETPDRPDVEEDVLKPPSGKDEYSSMTMEELEILLDEAIQVEDYDKAALIRDEINQRSKN